MENFKIPNNPRSKRRNRSRIPTMTDNTRFKSPKEVPYDTDGGEIIGILPYTLGSRQEILDQKAMSEMSDEELVARAMSNSNNPETAPSAAAAAALLAHGVTCPKCNHPSIRVMKNIVPGNEVCIGIPTCINIKCMYMSPNITQLPMPRLKSFEVNREEILKGRNLEDPHRDEVLMSYLHYGVYLKNNPSKPPLPIDKKAVEYYRNVNDKSFENVLKEVFDGVLPKMPGVRCLEDDDEVEDQASPSVQIKKEMTSIESEHLDEEHPDMTEDEPAMLVEDEIEGELIDLPHGKEETQEVIYDNEDEEKTQPLIESDDDEQVLVVDSIGSGCDSESEEEKKTQEEEEVSSEYEEENDDIYGEIDEEIEEEHIVVDLDSD